MPVVFKCDCGKFLSVRSKNIGKKIRCPVCSEINVVPDPSVKRSKRLKRLGTMEMDADGMERLKDAAESGEIAALTDDEEKKLALDESSVVDKKRSERKKRREKSSSDEAPAREPKAEAPSGSTKKKPAEQDEKKRSSRRRSRQKGPAEGDISILCFCGYTHHRPGSDAGKKFECDSCGRSVTIPGGGGGLELDLVPEEEGERCPYCAVVLKDPGGRCPSCGKKLERRYLEGGSGPPKRPSSSSKSKKGKRKSSRRG